MTPEIKSKIYANKRDAIVSNIYDALREQWESNKNLQDGKTEVWINKKLEIKTEDESFDGEWVCIFSPRMFSFVNYDGEDEIYRYDVEGYVTDILRDIDSVDIADELLYSYSLENYYEED